MYSFNIAHLISKQSMIQELGFDPISAQFTRRDRYQVVKLERVIKEPS